MQILCDILRAEILIKGEGAMKQKIYVMSALSMLCAASSIGSCPLCVDALGNVNKPFFYQDEEGRMLSETDCVCTIQDKNNT